VTPSVAGPATAAAAVVAAVREDRLWQRHLEVATIGATGRGGVNRQALTAEDAEARRRMLAWAAARGFEASVDPIGNLFIRRAGVSATASPIVSGSHLDTQPTGGNFDGVFGVLAALEVLEAVDDAGVETVHPFDLAIWTNDGSMSHKDTMRCLALMGQEVLPALREIGTELELTDPFQKIP